MKFMRLPMRHYLIPCAGLLAVAASLTSAQEGPVLAFTLGAGAQSNPAYFGADSNEIAPWLTLARPYLRLGNGFEIGSADPFAPGDGFGFRTSIRYVAARSALDYPELTGLEDIDQTVELGAGVTFERPGFLLFTDLRYGVIGHEALVAEAGADLILRPDPQWVLRVGPRMLFGSDDYAATYFGVTAAESLASGDDLAAYEARGGLVSAGVEAGFTYQINDLWAVEGAVNWSQLQGDAAESPIALQGSTEAVSAYLGITRRFNLRF